MTEIKEMFEVGSEMEDGAHERGTENGWPYSVFIRGNSIGATDRVLAHGIQHLGDAQALADMLNAHGLNGANTSPFFGSSHGGR